MSYPQHTQSQQLYASSSATQRYPYNAAYAPQANHHMAYMTSPATPYAQYPTFNHPAPSLVGQQAPAKQADVPAIDSKAASKAVTQLLTAQLTLHGFSGAQPLALERLEAEMVFFVQRLYEEAQALANLSNRPTPSLTDAAKVCNENSMPPARFRRALVKASRKRKRVARKEAPISLGDPPERSPSPDLLHSDEEAAMPHVPPTLRYLPPHFPPLPPRHTYLRTPVTAPTKKAVPSLEKKLANASLVQESLKSLIIATEDTKGPEDVDLVGHVVNWENAASARRSWKWD